MTTFDAIVVGMQDVTSIPRNIGIDGVPEVAAPAAKEI
jgi:hypothetical protein